MKIAELEQHLEPAAYAEDLEGGLMMQLSIAISVKRIADLLTNTDQMKEVIRELSLQPVNIYGEGLAAAIQNGIVRGKQGITSYD